MREAKLGKVKLHTVFNLFHWGVIGILALIHWYHIMPTIRTRTIITLSTYGYYLFVWLAIAIVNWQVGILIGKQFKKQSAVKTAAVKGQLTLWSSFKRAVMFWRPLPKTQVKQDMKTAKQREGISIHRYVTLFIPLLIFGAISMMHSRVLWVYSWRTIIMIWVILQCTFPLLMTIH